MNAELAIQPMSTDHWSAHGWLHLPAFMGQDETAALRGEADRLLRNRKHFDQRGAVLFSPTRSDRLDPVTDLSQPFAALAADPRLMGLVAALVGGRPQLMKDKFIAKPPGKKPATLSLLSGGEQSLTALALIFAVFLTNPSPICVLDEVDAPLDDANVDRFCTLLEKMSTDTDTRFLVITHHPMTMSRMNRLFGVTMAEKGVSQLVSVDLETAQKFTVAA